MIRLGVCHILYSFRDVQGLLVAPAYRTLCATYLHSWSHRVLTSYFIYKYLVGIFFLGISIVSDQNNEYSWALWHQSIVFQRFRDEQTSKSHETSVLCRETGLSSADGWKSLLRDVKSAKWWVCPTLRGDKWSTAARTLETFVRDISRRLIIAGRPVTENKSVNEMWWQARPAIFSRRPEHCQQVPKWKTSQSGLSASKWHSVWRSEWGAARQATMNTLPYIPLNTHSYVMRLAANLMQWARR